jgi:hypothetical protein
MIRFAVAFVLVAAITDAGAKCARTEQRPKVLTTRDTKLPDDGGILVGWENEVYSDASDHVKGDPSNQPDWAAFDRKTKLVLTRVSLAPGLSVYRVTGKATAVLKSKAGKTLGTFSHDAKAAANAMPPPAVSDVVLSIDDSERWSERHAKATLKVAPPPQAAALVVYAIGPKDNAAISFVTLPDTHDKLLKLDVFDDAGHCGSVVDGSRPPAKGEKLAFAWVDAFGRLSPVGATITAK